MNFQSFFVSLTLPVIFCQSWQFVAEDLIDYTISESNWGYNNAQDWSQGGGSQINSCPVNSIWFIYVQNGKNTAVYGGNTNIIPHYEIKVIVDGYFLDSGSNTITIKYDLYSSSTAYSLTYKDSGGNGITSYQAVCQTTFSNFEIQTFVMTYKHTDYDILKFRVIGTGFNPGYQYGTRSLQIFANPCHWSCLKCDNGSSSGCRACYTNPSNYLGSATSCGTCPSNTAYIEYLDVDKKCVTECNYYRVPDSNKVCQFNENMLPFTTLFKTNTFSVITPWIFIPDQINFNLDSSIKIGQIPCLTSYNYVGPFYQNEGIQYTLSLPYNISYIRFRITILKFGNWIDNSAVRLLLDSTEFGSIYSLSQVLKTRNADQLYSDTNCSGTVTFYRFETKMRTNFTNPILYIIGNMDTSNTQSWGFRDITIDIMKCQSSCSWCDFDLKCYACSSGFLYKNRCVPTCPPYTTASSSKCTDQDESQTEYISYLIKAFYDSSNTTDVDVANIVGPFTNITNNNFKTTDRQIFNYVKIFFSYYLNRRVLGGPLVWNSAYFEKTFTLNPHYKFNIKFTVVLGDSFQSSGGDFKYTVGGFPETTLSYSSGTAVTVNTGRSNTDKFIKVDRTETHYDTSFTIRLTCNSNQSVQNNFCLIYDYYVLIYECIPYCTACTGPTWALCTGQQTLPTGMSTPTSCVDNTYYYDTSVTPAVCTKCTPTYCLECSSSSLCTKCATNFYLSNGQCLCTPSTYLTASNTCNSCNKLCKTCFDSSSSSCLSCYDSQHRYINKNQCLCQNNYYDDGVNSVCQSICGDMVVTDGEDCDDGNTIRFDGCNNCKYECQKECLVCVGGKCQSCITGYFLHSTMKKCFPLCGDNMIVASEYCEDNNLTQYDGCYQCQFQCQIQCTNCVSGICQNCDNSIGYYINLANNRCETKCGDKILAGTEICDDGNITPFDGCHNCQLQCDNFCSVCILGVCQKCQNGYQLISQNNRCLPICGDKIVTFYESCDDGNLIKDDGCNQCQLQCQDQCTNCLVGKCLECNTSGYQLNKMQQKCYSFCGDNTITTFFEQCDDSNLQPEDGCYQCKYDCQAECQVCTLGICYQCQSNYYLNQEQKCQPICGDGVVAKYEYCDDKNFIFEDGCQDCQFKCEKTCNNCSFGVCKSCMSGYMLNSKTLKCDTICGDSLTLGFEQCDSGILVQDLTKKNITGCVECKLQCQAECEVCAQGQCQRCNQSKGWYLNIETGLCESFCGDAIISQYEQCEDSNSQLNDGCSSCQIDCQDECLTCNYGICTKCKLGYQLIDKKCYSICGDGIVVFNEDCDYGLQQINGCVNCKYKCEEGCNYCVNGKCQECKNNLGWYFNQIDQQCYTNCGDNIISGSEMCDGNSTSCNQCTLKCNSNCQQCLFGQCLKCLKGYSLYQNDCINICGDGLKVGIEQCDDTDLKPFDGCFNCQSQCQNECLNCYNGECIECDQKNGWYLISKKCQTICGDGIVAGDEQCDINVNFDNGQISKNKCFNCQYKCDNNCINCSLGTCLNCKIGFYLSDDNQCIQECNLTLSQVENMCVDDNLLAFDTCHACQYDCPENCEQCVYGECKNCYKGYKLNNQKCESICGDGYITADERCDDTNNQEFDGCHNCLYSCPENCSLCENGICSICEIGFHLEYNKCVTDCKDLIKKQSDKQCFVSECQKECEVCFYGLCYQCKSGWYWNDQKLECESKCGDDMITGLEECDYSSSLDQKSPLCSDQCKFQCPQNCQQCNFGFCEKCQIGFYLYENQCFSQCGDSRVIDQELCDDDNLQPFDGCFKCNLDCVDQCEICVNGVCEQCKVGYQLQENICVSICGDGFVSNDEQCDEKDFSSLAYCIQCKFECPKYCKFCEFGMCIFCQQGFYLKGKECLPICGDGLILGNEQCDDANLEAEDGCFECQYSCQSQCLVCYQGTCLTCMEDQGWHLSPQGNCETECGDMIVTGNEQCDDGNLIVYDGCYQCNFICQEACTLCISGACYECNTPGWRLEDFYCWEICGDGLKVGIEQCDDTDLKPFDGCFNCQSQCQNECLNCYNGECIECDQKNGWYLISKKCQTICGDGIIAGDEQCDVNVNYDNGQISKNKCLNCQYKCDNNCINCSLGTCLECKIGFYLSDDNQCIQQCNLTLSQVENTCVDDNLSAFDTCHACQYDCPKNCEQCIYGECKNCYKGYKLNNQKCESICGDGYITADERCDDTNNQEFDGCHNCLYSCPENCSLCENGICSICEIGFHLEYNKCVTDCKDLIKKQSDKQCFVSECQKECEVCFYGLCYQCKSGWYWNDQKLECESKCGDDMITGLEECDYSSSLDQKSPLCSDQCKFQCPQNCQQCNFGICQKCQIGFYLYENQCFSQCGDSRVIDQELCDDDNLQPFDGCFKCNLDCVDQCEICVNGVCEQCKVGYQLQENICVSICGDGYVSNDEQCDEKDYSSLAYCNQCKFECPKYCKFCEFGMCIFCQQGFYLKGKECLPICGDGLILGNEQCDDANLEAEDGCFECQYSCQSQCLVCYQGSCLTCMEDQGWHLSPQGNCVTECGDMIVTGNEQCDDGNDKNFDGCFECKYICQTACTKCITGSCYECNTPGWRLEDFYCWEICGDGLKVGIEECDDGNDLPYDGCFNCKTQCEEACVSCFAGQCNGCAFGWKLNSQHRCEADCGDSYVLPLFEDCDDGNNIAYDGCYECNFQCVQHCTNCQKGICYECNTPGWQYQNDTFLCVPVCGDGAINGNEMCDDGNLINFDGCSDTCAYQCHIGCIDCNKGICQQCDQNLGYFVEGNQCGSLCGDGLWEPNSEQCEDGNLFNNDGCSNLCKIEINWYCESQLSAISNCIYRKFPEIIVNSLNQQNDKIILQVKFSTKMKLNDQNFISKNNKNKRLSNNFQFDDLNILDIKLEQLNETQYQYQILPIVPVNVEPLDIEYQIQIQLLNNIQQEKLKIYVIADDKLILSENSVQLIENTGFVAVPVKYFIDQQSAYILSKIQDYQEFQTYSYLLISGLSVMTSGFSNLLIACDTIQYLYYSKYINIEFPQNLQQFQSNLKLQSIPNKISNYTSAHLFNKEKENTTYDNDQMAEKFSNDNLEFNFLQNSLSSLVIASASFSVFFIALGVSNLIHMIRISTIQKLGNFLGGILQTLSEKSQQITKDFQYSGAIRVFTVNFYDLAFASLLQLSNTNISNPEQIGQAIIAAFTLMTQMGFILLIFHKIRQLQLRNSIESKQSIKTLFSNINGEKSKQFWNMQFNTFLLVKKLIYITLIVDLQQQGLYQTICVGLQASVFSSYLILARPISKIDDYRKCLIAEVGMVALSLSFILYSLNDQLQLQQDQLFYLGWINIGIYNVILTSNLIIDALAQVKLIVAKFKTMFNKIIKNQLPSQSRVQPIFV